MRIVPTASREAFIYRMTPRRDTSARWHLRILDLRNFLSFILAYLVPPILVPSFSTTIKVVLPWSLSCWITHTCKPTCLGIDSASSQCTGAGGSTHEEIITIDLWRPRDVGLLSFSVSPSSNLSCSLPLSLFLFIFRFFFNMVSSSWICIIWMRVKSRRKRKTKDIAALSMGC